MALSIMLTFNILKYIRKLLHMRNFVYFCKRLMNCPNIIQIVAKIKNLKKFDKLVFLIPIVGATLTISKIIILINIFHKKVILAIYLQNLLFEYMKNNGRILIKTFILILKLDIKSKYLKNFCNNDIKI